MVSNMKFEDIKKVNETILTINVKGKEYAEVNQRIKAFRMLYPEGFIHTNIEHLEDGICVIKAEVGFYGRDGNYETKNILGTGIAYEKENSTFINKTSYIENCETSAVGRALAMCGIGIDTSVASAEEVTNAINNQNKDSIEDIEGLIKETETNVIDILTHFGRAKLTELTPDEIVEARTILLKKLKNTNFKKAN